MNNALSKEANYLLNIKERLSTLDLVDRSEELATANRERDKKQQLPPTVAVIIPYYNGAAWIERAIKSVLAQSTQADEFVIVDDGSDRDQRDTLYELKEIYRFTIVGKTNGGQGSARNLGVANTTAQFISFLDQDDFYLPNHIKDLVGALPEHDPRLGWVYADLVEGDIHGQTVDTNMLRNQMGAHPKTGHISKILRSDLFILPSASLICRSAFDAVGGFDEQFVGYEDDDLFLRMIRANFTNYFLDRPVTVWCMHTGSTSWSIKMAKSRFLYFNKLRSLYPDDPERNIYYFRDCIVPRFGQVFELDALKAGRIHSVNYAVMSQIFRDYCAIIKQAKHIPRWHKRRLQRVEFIANRPWLSWVYSLYKYSGIRYAMSKVPLIIR